MTLLKQSKKRGSIIEEIEGGLNLLLDNPLSLVGVKGYDRESFIGKITVTVFYLLILRTLILMIFASGHLKFTFMNFECLFVLLVDSTSFDNV